MKTDVKPQLETKSAGFVNQQFSIKAKSLIQKNLTAQEKAALVHYFVYTRAMNRAVIGYERNTPDSVMMHSKENCCIFFERKISELANITSQDAFDKWHHLICTNKDFGMRYGLWQKLINISLKYMYCVQDIFPEYSTALKYAHCPIDRVIAKNILADSTALSDEEVITLLKKIAGKKAGATWNYISEEQYCIIQRRIHDICLEKGLVIGNRYISNLEYDILKWKP